MKTQICQCDAGLLFARLFDRVVEGAEKECGILMVGLDAAGKTTILYKLKLGEVQNTRPTIGRCHHIIFTIL